MKTLDMRRAEQAAWLQRHGFDVLADIMRLPAPVIVEKRDAYMPKEGPR